MSESFCDTASCFSVSFPLPLAPLKVVKYWWGEGTGPSQVYCQCLGCLAFILLV
jgi:hypothetical protein